MIFEESAQAKWDRCENNLFAVWKKGMWVTMGGCLEWGWMFPQIKGGSEKGGYQFLENGGDRRSSVSTFHEGYTPFLLPPSSQGTGGPTVTQVLLFQTACKETKWRCSFAWALSAKNQHLYYFELKTIFFYVNSISGLPLFKSVFFSTHIYYDNIVRWRHMSNFQFRSFIDRVPYFH